MLRSVRARVPPRIKKPIRRLLDFWIAAHHKRALRRGILELREQATSDGIIAPELIGDLAAAWCNQAYAADVRFLSEVLTRVQRNAGPFLDCGSGLTTILAGAVADVRGKRLWSLEQNERWHDTVRQALATLQINAVELWHAPLRSYGDFAWYDVQGRMLPGEFTHIFCDGPAIGPKRWKEPIYSSWRVGAVPVLQSLGIRFGEIILDDAQDPRCPFVCRRWNELGIRTRIVDTATGSYVHGSPGDYA